MRGTREFADRASHEAFLREIFAARNKGRIARLGDDLRGMNELPPMRIEDFRRERVTVTRFSTIRAADNTYSVSSRLIGELVDLRLYAETIEVCMAHGWWPRWNVSAVAATCRSTIDT